VSVVRQVRLVFQVLLVRMEYPDHLVREDLLESLDLKGYLDHLVLLDHLDL
jgi:hypothetical protein